MTPRVLSGIQPSGDLHVGNYFGMMKPCVDMQGLGDTFLFIADYHSLTTIPEPELLRNRSRGVAVDFLACGIDPDKTVFFRQSDVPQVHELTWILNCLTPVGLLERCHSYKDKVAKGFATNNGLFSYPVLMAADILLYKSTLVPVGKDQKQHLEVARDIAIRFNNAYGEILTIPEAKIGEEVALVPGIDGQKMSKSYDNTIEIFGAEKASRKKIMSVVTDSLGLEEPKKPDNCNVFALYKLFASEDEQAEMRTRYRAGAYGYGHAKQALFEKFLEYFAPFQEKRRELLDNPAKVEEILGDGAAKARAVAAATLRQVREAIGIASPAVKLG